MKLQLLLISAITLASEAFAPTGFMRRPVVRSTPKMAVSSAAASAAAAALLTSSVAISPVTIPETFAPVEQAPVTFMKQAPMTVSAVYELREGTYKSYEVEVKEQAVDDAASTFKTAKATAKGKSKYIGVLGVLVVGSFIIPMLQYFWYVKEE